VRFKIINREGLVMDPLTGTPVIPATPDGNPRPPEATEMGYKDTVVALPGEVTRVQALFDIKGLYVWHCHILEHEDNEMMLPYCVGGKSGKNCPGSTVPVM
jgi:spore coat protein A